MKCLCGSVCATWKLSGCRLTLKRLDTKVLGLLREMTVSDSRHRDNLESCDL